MTDYGSLKVADLKALLKERSLSQSGRKSDLIVRLEDADSKVAHAENTQVTAAGSVDEAVPQQPADVEQPQQDKVKGEIDGPSDIPAVVTGEGNAPQADAAPADVVTNGECAAGKGEEEQAEAEDTVQNEAVNAGNTDAGSLAIAPGKDATHSPGSGHAHDAEIRTDDPQATADPQTEVVPVRDDDTTAVPTDHGEGASEAHPAEVELPAKVVDPPEESDSLGLNDSESEQHDAKEDVHTAAQSAGHKDDIAPDAEVNAPPRSDPPANMNVASADDAPSATGQGARRPGDGQDAAGGPPPAAKRKHAAIVFPDAATQADRPAPTKREKVELVVPEATDETRALCISGLKRPLREGDLKDILSKTGTIQGFWIDSCKTHCYVVYATVEEAKTTLDAVDGLQWPPRCRSVMRPKFVAVEEAQGMIDSKGAATLTRVPSTSAPGGGADAKDGEAEGQAEEKNGAQEQGEAAEPVIDLTKAGPRVARRDASQIAAGGSAPPELAPSELFNLTQATPSLYWLPLSEEQVEQRRSVDAARRLRAASATAASADTGAGAAEADGDKPAPGEKDDGAEDGGAAEGAAPVVESQPDGDVEMVDADEEKGAGEE